MEEVSNIVAILSGESVAGQALGLLLQSVGYQTRLLTEPDLDEVGGLLDGVQLLILAPTVSERYREDFLRSIEYVSVMAGKPVLELVTSSSSLPPLTRGRVLWPCRIEELQREIETALLVGSESSGALSVERDTGSPDGVDEDIVDVKTA